MTAEFIIFISNCIYVCLPSPSSATCPFVILFLLRECRCITFSTSDTLSRLYSNVGGVVWIGSPPSVRPSVRPLWRLVLTGGNISEIAGQSVSYSIIIIRRRRNKKLIKTNVKRKRTWHSLICRKDLNTLKRNKTTQHWPRTVRLLLIHADHNCRTTNKADKRLLYV